MSLQEKIDKCLEGLIGTPLNFLPSLANSKFYMKELNNAIQVKEKLEFLLDLRKKNIPLSFVNIAGRINNSNYFFTFEDVIGNSDIDVYTLNIDLPTLMSYSNQSEGLIIFMETFDDGSFIAKLGVIIASINVHIQICKNKLELLTNPYVNSNIVIN